MVGTGTCIALIAIGAILRFALSAGSPHGLNVHVLGVVTGIGVVVGELLVAVEGGGEPGVQRRPGGMLPGRDGGGAICFVRSLRIWSLMSGWA